VNTSQTALLRPEAVEAFTFTPVSHQFHTSFTPVSLPKLQQEAKDEAEFFLLLVELKANVHLVV